jgi:hypothetical protein
LTSRLRGDPIIDDLVPIIQGLALSAPATALTIHRAVPYSEEKAVFANPRTIVLALLGVMVAMGAAQAQTTTVTVSSSDSAAWIRSNGGTGTSMPAGGPGVWNSRFVTTIPVGATNISFTLDSFFPDDKGVVQSNGTTVGDGVIFFGNGTAAGAGTFDFGSGNFAYTYVGFTPGTATALPNGTTNFELVGYINDTNVSDPSAPPLSVTNISGFSLEGALKYDAVAVPPSVQAPIPTLSEWGTILLGALLMAATLVWMRRKRH